jgi:hypothetical protein
MSTKRLSAGCGPGSEAACRPTTGMCRATAVPIGPWRLLASAKMAMPSGLSAIAWLKPASQPVGLPLPSMTVNLQPRERAAAPI